MSALPCVPWGCPDQLGAMLCACQWIARWSSESIDLLSSLTISAWPSSSQVDFDPILWQSWVVVVQLGFCNLRSCQHSKWQGMPPPPSPPSMSTSFQAVCTVGPWGCFGYQTQWCQVSSSIGTEWSSTAVFAVKGVIVPYSETGGDCLPPPPAVPHPAVEGSSQLLGHMAWTCFVLML